MYSLSNFVRCSTSNSNCRFLSPYRLLRRQVRLTSIPKDFPQFVVIHTVKGFSIVNEAEVDVFLEFSCFFYDPADIGNLISGSSVFPNSSLNIWKFWFHVLLKIGLENFEHYFASMWNEYNCAVVWILVDIALSWDLNENWPFVVLCLLLNIPYLLAYLNSAL